MSENIDSMVARTEQLEDTLKMTGFLEKAVHFFDTKKLHWGTVACHSLEISDASPRIH